MRLSCSCSSSSSVTVSMTTVAVMTSLPHSATHLSSYSLPSTLGQKSNTYNKSSFYINCQGFHFPGLTKFLGFPCVISFFQVFQSSAVADPKGCPGTRPLGSNSFVFMQFFAKNFAKNRLAHPPGAAPPTGKSWIRHWSENPELHIKVIFLFSF